MKFYLDLKGSDKLSYELHSLFTKMNIDTTNIWMASFNLNHIDILNKINKYNLGLISENNYTLDMLTYLTSKYNLKFIAFGWTVLNKNTIQFLKSKNLYLYYKSIISNKFHKTLWCRRNSNRYTNIKLILSLFYYFI